MKVMHRQIRVARADLHKYGYTPHCNRCLDSEAGACGTKARHSDECRLRIYLKYCETNDKTWQAVEGRILKQAKPAGDKEEIRRQGIEKPEPETMEEPMAPETHLSKSNHLQSG